MLLVLETKPAKIVLRPMSLRLDNASECAQSKGIRGMVERKSDAAPVGVIVVPVSSSLPSQGKTIGVKESTGAR